MGLMDFFKRNDGNSAAKQHWKQATKDFKIGNYPLVFVSLLNGFNSDINYIPLYSLCSATLEKLNSHKEAALFDAVVQDPKSITAFSQLGQHYTNSSNYSWAVVFLEKAKEAGEVDNNVLHDLAVCYARMFRIKEAIEVLEALDKDNFWIRYFLSKCKLMNNDRHQLSENIEWAKVEAGKVNDAETSYRINSKILELEEMQLRHESVKEMRTHICEWHFIQYGGAIMNFVIDDDEYKGGGRYYGLAASKEVTRRHLSRLKQFLQLAAVKLDVVVYIDNRDSEITARSIALILGLEARAYKANQELSNCLVVGSDSSCFDNFSEFETVKNGVVLFAMMHNWMVQVRITPDIIGFMGRYHIPWYDGEMMEGMNNGKQKYTQNSSARDIALDLYNTSFIDEGEEVFMDFYIQRKNLLKGIGNGTSNKRYQFMEESPVPGIYW